MVLCQSRMTEGVNCLGCKEKKSVITKITEQQFQECLRQEIGCSVQGDCLFILTGKILIIQYSDQNVEKRSMWVSVRDDDKETPKPHLSEHETL